MKRLCALLFISGVTIGIGVMPAHADNENRDDERNGDCRRASHCSDDDLSPEFYDSPVSVWICLPESTCNIRSRGDGKEEQA